MQRLVNEISYVAIDTRARHLNRGAAPKNVRRMSVVSASGILIDPKRHWSLTHYARLPEECTLDEIADSSGEWTALAVERNDTSTQYLLFGDHAGFAPMYYAHVTIL